MKTQPASRQKHYEKPSIEPLGTVVDLTAGPDGGNIDQLVGSSGGFQTVDPS